MCEIHDTIQTGSINYLSLFVHYSTMFAIELIQFNDCVP